MKIKDEIKKMVDISEHRKALLEHIAEEADGVWIPQESMEQQQKFRAKRFPSNNAPKKE